MSPLELELQTVKDNLYDMLGLVKSQLIKCKEAIEKKDTDLAAEIIADEKKVNIQELAIDRDCENILALYTPVATDLRLVLATLKISNELERIGDSAKSLAKVLSTDLTKKKLKWIDQLNIYSMLEVLVTMLKDMGTALRKEDTKPALKAAKKDEELNDCCKKAVKTAAALLVKNPDAGKGILTLL